MPLSAGSCRVTDSVPTQGIWPPARYQETDSDCHGKEGVAGSSPAEGLAKGPACSAFSLPGFLGAGALSLPGPLFGRIRIVVPWELRFWRPEVLPTADSGDRARPLAQQFDGS